MKPTFPVISCLILAFVLMSQTAHAIMPWEVRWHNEQSDTTCLTNLLKKGVDSGLSDGDLIVFFGEQFIDKPYAGGTLEGEPEMLTVNVDEFDCTTFVETVLALTTTVGERRAGWQDFIHNLESLRYRQGNLDDYSSRLHYISDWIVDNSHRGNLHEVTDRWQGVGYNVKSLDFMTKHRSSYSALADSTQFTRMKSVETGYRSHRFPYIKTSNLSGKSGMRFLNQGDILAFTTKTAGLDVSHMGIVVVEADGPHLLHASSKAGRVVKEKTLLSEYLKKNPGVTGARVIRIGER